MIISRQDLDGVKPLLQTGEFGYDNYPAGGDDGRVYVGTGSANIPLAKKAEMLAVDGKADVHIARVDNPHGVTKAQVGLGNADDTSDADKPISTATQSALDLKANADEVYSKIELDAGQLDNRYYTETEIDTLYSTTVKLTGNQTIADVKTFMSSPVVPNPTANTQAANKAYVDNVVANPTLTANATLTAINNKIVMNGIVASLGLEIGDVIQFTSVANANNQKMRTVESIINNNEIIVNYEHCGSRGNGALKLTDETLTNATITRIAKWYNAPIGIGQEWVTLTGFRVGNTNYTNTTKRTITMYAMLGSAAIQTASIIVGDVETSFSTFVASNGNTGATAPVNAGGIYKSFAAYGSQTVVKWAELR